MKSYFWGVAVISVIYLSIQSRKNAKSEDQIQSLEESIDESVEVETTGL